MVTMDKIEYCLNCDLYQRPAIGEPGQCIYTGECVLTTPNTHDRNAALAAMFPEVVEALESIAYLAAKGIDYARDERTYEQAKQTLAAARAAMEATDD